MEFILFLFYLKFIFGGYSYVYKFFSREYVDKEKNLDFMLKKILCVRFLYFVGWLFDIGLFLCLVIFGFNKYSKWDKFWFRRMFI